MIKADLLNAKGEKVSQVSLPKEIFGAKVNPALMSQAVRVYLSNQRKAGAKTKTRGEVAGSGIKIWRQKGTGRARHGDRYAPIFVGGGVAHGPTGQENYSLKMSKKMKKKALFSALTRQLKDNHVVFVKGLGQVGSKTKPMVQALGKISQGAKKVLLILPEKVEAVIRSARNIDGTELVFASLLNPYQVLKNECLVFMEEALPVLEKNFLRKETEKIKPKKD
jgi:large subunit ribosomal protein L4